RRLTSHAGSETWASHAHSAPARKTTSPARTRSRTRMALRTAVREGRQPAAVSRSLPELRTSLGLSTENQANQLRSTRACSAVSRPPRQYRAYGLPHFVLAW